MTVAARSSPLSPSNIPLLLPTAFWPGGRRLSSCGCFPNRGGPSEPNGDYIDIDIGIGADRNYRDEIDTLDL